MVSRLLIILCFFSALFSCKSRDENSESKHSVNEPIRSKGPWQWQEVSKEEYRSIVSKADGANNKLLIFPDPKDTTGATDVAARMQYWVNRFDANLRDRYPDHMREVPTPKTVLVRDPSLNAYVSSIPICIAMELRINPEVNEIPENQVNYVSLSTDGFIDSADQAPTCLRRSVPPEFVEQLVAWFNSNRPDCRIRRDEKSPVAAPIYTLDKLCPVAPQLEEVSRTHGVVLTTTANWIAVNTGLVSSLPREEYILQTIAHELSHYYRSHMTIFENEYDFFYSLEGDHPTHRPKADPSLKVFGRTVFQNSRLINLPEVKNQRFHSALFQPISELVRNHCHLSVSNCSRECLVLVQFYGDERFDKWFGDFPEGEPLKRTGKAQYHTFEQKFAACGKTIKVGSSLVEADVSTRRLNGALRRAKIDQLLKDTPAATTLDATMDVLTDALRSARASADDVIRSAYAQKLGYYTSEQEADDLGLEQSVALGLNPETAIESDIFFYKLDEATPESVDETERPDSDDPILAGTSMADCEAYYRRTPRWSKGDGTFFMPSIADYYDDHHSPCFRIYNVDRESVAHNYPRSQSLPDGRLAQEQWEALRKQAGILQKGVARGVNRRALLRAKTMVDSCPLLKTKY